MAPSTRTLFKYFEEAGDGNYAVTFDEALAGITKLAGEVGHFYDEFNYFWNFFDANDDECVSHNEIQDMIEAGYQVSQAEIISYWINYYYTTFGVTEYYWWIFHLPNGGFDWDGYYDYVPDGPAFDGAEWIVLHGDWEDGYLQEAFMWFIDD